MKSSKENIITIEATIKCPVEKVWKLWTDPFHIEQWNNASEDWHTPEAENDLRAGGRFRSRMEARDGSKGFEFSGEYTKIEPLHQIDYTLDDERTVQIKFVSEGEKTTITESFEAETTNSLELQKSGWQSILDNFKKYAEKSATVEKLKFTISIDSPALKVYNIMLDDKHYQEWTSVFNPTSRYIGSWEKGSKIRFMGTEKDGTEGGMVSRIRENIRGRFVGIEHLGFIRNGKEITSGPEIEGWAGAHEDYSLTDLDGKTLLIVELDTVVHYKTYFEEHYPKALQLLKSICESQTE